MDKKILKKKILAVLIQDQHNCKLKDAIHTALPPFRIINPECKVEELADLFEEIKEEDGSGTT